jgi:hypothetical protein
MLGLASSIVLGTYPGGDANSWAYHGDGAIYTNAAWSTFGTAFVVGDTLMMAWDCVNKKVWWGKNSTWINSGNPSGGTNAAFTLSGTQWMPSFRACLGFILCNFGQGGQSGLTYNAASGGRFKYAPPAGFKALSTANLSAPAIKKPTQHFNAVTWTGDGTTNKSITGVGFSSNLIWTKKRTGSTGLAHGLVDTERGTSKILFSNQTSAEDTSSGILSIGADGFNVSSSYNSGMVNESGQSIVAWCWKSGSGSGFDIQTFDTAATGANQVFNHSLGAVPQMIIIKSRNLGSDHWYVYHSAVGAGSYLTLDTSNASTAYANVWGNTAPTATQFTLGTSWSAVYSYVAYLWAEVPGFSKFGSYSGNGVNQNGPFVYCGFKPRWILIKRADAASSTIDSAWAIYDSARNPYNDNSAKWLSASSSIADCTANTATQSLGLDILSNGFKVLGDYGSDNAAGGTYIFAAFAEAPFKYATAR